MMRAVMESSGLALWPVLSLVLFSLFTLALLFWLYRRGSKGYYDKMACLALFGETGESGESGKRQSEGAARDWTMSREPGRNGGR